jgi:hypothetical protein
LRCPCTLDHYSAGNDVIGSKGGSDYLDGGSGNDIVFGGICNDAFLGRSGDDVLPGGRSDLGQWSFYLNTQSELVARHNTVLTDANAYESVQATELNSNIAELSFAHAQPGALNSLALFYHAAFDRTPDLAGLSYWANSPLNVDAIVKSFTVSAEWMNVAGKLSNLDFVQTLYQPTSGSSPNIIARGARLEAVLA